MPGTTQSASAPDRLAAFLAALSELDESERARLLRAYLEYALEIVQANEEEYYIFLGECAMLAADNMQDIRLEHLELRADAIESPPTKQWGEAITDVALGLALQVGMLFGWEAVAAGVISLAGWRELTRVTRSARVELHAARSKNSALQSVLLDLQQEKSRLRLLERSGFDVAPTRGGWQVKPYPNYDNSPGFTAPRQAFDASTGRVSRKYVRDEYDKVTAQIAIAQSATLTNSVRVSKALKTHDAALANGIVATEKIKKAWGNTWRENIGNEKGGVLLGTTQDVLDGIDAVLASGGEALQPAAVSGAPASEPFLSSEVTGRYLTWASDERLEIVESYANMRLMLRATSDSDLKEGDDVVRMIAFLGTDVLQRWQELRHRPHAARAAIVKGIEAAFWREYLLANGILAKPSSVRYKSRKQHGSGKIEGEYLIVAAGQKIAASEAVKKAQQAVLQESVPEPVEDPPPVYEHDALHYPGMSRIQDLLAKTLFHRFAQPHFADEGKASLLRPFLYKPALYGNIQVPPIDGFWGYPEPEALNRINEMRFMVLRFFQDLVQDAVDPTMTAVFGGLRFMSSVTGSEAAKVRDDWLKGQAQGVDASGQGPDDAVEAALNATVSAERRFAEMAQTTTATPADSLALLRAQMTLSDQLTDLNQDIQAFQLLKNGALEIGRTVGQRTPEDLEWEIEREKEALARSYDELLKLVVEDAEERARLEATYRPAVDAIRQWQPGSDWVWYGADGALGPPGP